MAAYKQMSEEESLKRSHSKFSNAKLTLLCLLAAIALVGIIALIASLKIIPQEFIAFVWIGVIIFAGLCALSLLLFSKFKR